MSIINKSFQEWCEETDNNWIIDLWDYDLNNISPEKVNYRTAKKYYFKCPRGIHDSELSKINNITGEKHFRPTCRRCSSFGQWCIDNNYQDLLDRWNYELNKISPFDVFKSSSKKYYFNCPYNNPLHKPELKMISNVIKQEGSRKCSRCNSFGQWGIDNVDPDFIEKYWSEKNTIDPFIIQRRSGKKVWIKCQNVDYHEDYQISCANFTKGKRCPYCINHKVHPLDSLGTKNPRAFLLWSENNKLTPFDYAPNSNQKIDIYCQKHGLLSVTICTWNTDMNCNCPECIKEELMSSYEAKVYDYLQELGYVVLREDRCNLKPINPRTGSRLYYDNEIQDLSLIIEVNGEQHYKICQWTVLSSIETGHTTEQVLEYQQWKDEFKKQYAIQNNYHYLEIPYTACDFNSHEYKILIDNKIKEITS